MKRIKSTTRLPRVENDEVLGSRPSLIKEGSQRVYEQDDDDYPHHNFPERPKSRTVKEGPLINRWQGVVIGILFISLPIACYFSLPFDEYSSHPKFPIFIALLCIYVAVGIAFIVMSLSSNRVPPKTL